MKKLFYVSLAATLLLQACSTGKSFSKKRYGHLKWIDHNTTVDVPGKETQEGTQTEAPLYKKQDVTSTTPAVEEKTETVVPVQDQKTAVVQNVEPAPVAPASFPVKKQPVADQEITENDQPINTETVNEVENPQQAEKISSPEPMMDDDLKLIICVILCLIIPPLAMYLWDRQTDTWFVVDLILFLLWIFVIIGYGWGLAALLSVIIAFLRVFDLI